MIWKSPREFYFRTGANCTSSDSNSTTRTVNNDDQYSRQVKLRWRHRSSAGFSWRNRRQQAHKPFLELHTLFQEVNSQFDDNSIIPLLFAICWGINCIPEAEVCLRFRQRHGKDGGPWQERLRRFRGNRHVQNKRCRQEAQRKSFVGWWTTHRQLPEILYNIHISWIKWNSKYKLLTEWTSFSFRIYFRCLYGVDLTLVALKRILILCGTPEMQRLMHWCSAQ